MIRRNIGKYIGKNIGKYLHIYVKYIKKIYIYNILSPRCILPIANCSDVAILLDCRRSNR